MNNSNLPMGAANDPAAPWNQPEPELEECPNCKGTGQVYYSCCGDDMRSRLPDDDTCPTCHEHCGDEGEDCEMCEGTGQIEAEKSEPDPDAAYDQQRENEQ